VVIHQESCKTNDEITTKKVEDGERGESKKLYEVNGIFQQSAVYEKWRLVKLFKISFGHGKH